MILCDVNVFVYAFRADLDGHVAWREWLTDHVNGDEPMAVSGVVASGFVRVVTNRRVFAEPSSLDMAFLFLTELHSAPATFALHEGPHHAGIFERLCRHVRARGNDVPDAYLAALAIESGCEFVTADRGFARFPDLRLRDPVVP